MPWTSDCFTASPSFIALDAMIAESRAQLPTQMPVTERAERLSNVAEAVVTIPGVVYRPERISYKGIL